MNSPGTDTKDFLHRQLVRLGDMMGDGEHLEPGGKWIEREYGKILRALGIGPSRRRPRSQFVIAQIDEAMKRRIAEVPCQKCGGALSQTRKGSTVASCGTCGSRFRLLKIVHVKARRGGIQ